MDPYVTDWLDLLLRWLHVVAGIVWIGTSFYFVAVDSHLRPTESEGEPADEAWEIHGGGFYRVVKLRGVPRELPRPLYWFKWEAYTTWLSGFALFVVLYYARADEALIDRGVADISQGTAIVVSIALLAAAWLVYDGLCRLLRGREALLAAAIVALVTATSYGLFELYAPRAAAIQLGAMLGTIMAANVFLVIIPAHRRLLQAPDPALGARGKQRSVHNNYLTLPVVFTMIAGHFPSVIGHVDAWAALVALMAVGAWIRVFFNLRHRGRNVWEIPVTAALAIAAIAVWLRPPEPQPAGRAVSFDEARAIVDGRCLSCHSGVSAAGGLRLDDDAVLRARARDVAHQVSTNAMPPGNATGMTDEERDLLVAWALTSDG
ncbi:MAG: urate hydroxylase PuuD [Gaiellaceae bacterium]